MSENTTIPERADVRQLRIQAKEFLRDLPAGSKLADAQREIARKHGFSSWPRLVAEVETPVLVERLKGLVERGDADGLDGLLRKKPALRKRLNDPMFAFDSPPIFRASGHPQASRLLPVLVRHGADPNVRTSWWAGGFGALDHAREEVVDLLLGLGARWDVWSAAAHGRVGVLRELLDKDPSSVNAPGGDGQRPLHVAKDVETAELLIARGADLEVKDVDHEGTPLQYQIKNEPVARLLVARGAKPDVFSAAVLNDVEALRRIVAEDPSAPMARVGKAPFATVDSNGGHIYEYNLGRGKTPQGVAAQFGSAEVLEELERHSPLGRILVAAAFAGDAATVARLKGAEIDPEDASAIAWAAHDGRAEAVRLLLEAGFDPTAPGMDSGSALHVACWFGHLEVVRLLVDRVPLDSVDAHHGSPPLGWACHGAQHCRNPKGDYVGVVEALLDAGADPSAPANSGGTSMTEQAGDREDVKAVLRRFREAPDHGLPQGGGHESGGGPSLRDCRARPADSSRTVLGGGRGRGRRRVCIPSSRDCRSRVRAGARRRF